MNLSSDLPQVVVIGKSRSALQAFTLLELLITIGIIILLAGMIIGSISAIRERARESVTATRIQFVLDALTNYDSVDGSSALSLQTHLPIGGVSTFATIRAIDNTITSGAAAQPPGFLFNYATYQYNAPPIWSVVTLDTSNYRSGINLTESSRLFRRLADTVFDVMPLGVTTTTSSSQYMGWWPAQWPQTDWMSASPGMVPPILRFPWGREGMRIDGSLCDASLPPGLILGPNAPSLLENTHSEGYAISKSETLANSWATLGPSSGNATAPWTWTANDPTQTDWVTLSSAFRSDGTSVPSTSLGSNLPMPFDLGYLSPLQTINFLLAAGVLSAATGANDYRTNRSTSAPWNDAWGNPLIVVYAIFQPERYIRNFDGQDRRDLFLRSAKQGYQFDRAIYFAVGSTGKTLYPNLPSTWASGADSTTLQSYWLQIRDVCNAASWTESSFDSPPWNGVKVGKKNGARSLLSAPTIVK